MIETLIAILESARSNSLATAFITLHGFLGFSSFAVIPFSIRWYRQRNRARLSSSELHAQSERLATDLANAHRELSAREHDIKKIESDIRRYHMIMPHQKELIHVCSHEIEEIMPDFINFRSNTTPMEIYEGNSSVFNFLYWARIFLSFQIYEHPEYSCARSTVSARTLVSITDILTDGETHANYQPFFESDDHWRALLLVWETASEKGETRSLDWLAFSYLLYGHHMKERGERMPDQLENQIASVREKIASMRDVSGQRSIYQEMPNAEIALVLIGDPLADLDGYILNFDTADIPDTVREYCQRNVPNSVAYSG